MRKVCLLGASGSIGKQTLDVIYHHPEDFELVGFSVGHRVNAIDKILKKFNNVKAICVQEESSLPLFKQKYPHITFYHGDVLVLHQKGCSLHYIHLDSFSTVTLSIDP